MKLSSWAAYFKRLQFQLGQIGPEIKRENG
jgi:hypothetical protein